MDDFFNNNDENKELNQNTGEQHPAGEVDKDFPDSGRGGNYPWNNSSWGGNQNFYNNYGNYGGYGSYPPVQQKTEKSTGVFKTALIIISVVLFIVTAVFASLISAYSSKIADLQTKVSALENSDSTINYFVPEIKYEDTTSPYEAISTKGIQQTVMIQTKFEYSYTARTSGMFGSTSNTYTSSGSSSGSGVLYYEDEGSTYIITNNHVVSLSADDIGTNISNFNITSRVIKVYITGKTNPVEAEYIGGTEEYDIAVLKIGLGSLNCLVNSELGTYDIRDSKTLKYGEEIVAVGNALGLGLSTTTGVISRPEIYLESASNIRYVQIDAVINNGNSGGPSFDMCGKLVGINCASLESLGSGFNMVTVDGTNFAIPANTAVAIADNIIANNGVKKVAVGVTIEVTDLDWDIQDGVYAVHSQQLTVSSVTLNSAASSAGIKSGDILYSMDGEAIVNKGHWLDMLFNYSVGDTVEIIVLRDGEEVALSLTFQTLLDIE